MKKLVFFHHNTMSVGAGLSALHILRSIPTSEFDITVSLPMGRGDLEDKLLACGIRVRRDFPKPYSYMHISGYSYRAISISHVHNIMDVLQYTKIVKRVIREEQPDIVIVNSMTLFWIGNIVKRVNADIKLICFDRETYCHGSFGLRTHYIKNKLNRYFDKIVFLSEFDKNETGKENDKYVVITDKVDVEKYTRLNLYSCREELNLPMNDKLILFVGGVSKLKGIETALKMINYMKQDAKLVVLQYEKTVIPKGRLRYLIQRGRGMGTAYWCENYIKSQELSGKLILRGCTDEVEKYFVACDLIVFPSMEPHQARPIFEAGAAQRPIIVSEFDNTKEFLSDENGWTASSINYKQWAKLAEEILKGGEAVSARVKINFDKTLTINDINILRQEISNLLASVL